MSHPGVIHRCSFCGETFEIDKDDPHWSTGRGPFCPNRPPPAIAQQDLTKSDLTPTEHDHVINHVARCRKHNTVRAHADEPCWKCWKERKAAS
jgi:hypothetical protein